MTQKAALAIPVLANIDSLRAAMKESVSLIATTKQEMQKMGNAFDGSRIIAQAGAIANKFKDVTDVTKLTAKEQAQVNKVLDEAIQKYKALGGTAPAHVQALYDATKKVEAAATGAGNSQGWLATKTVALGTAIGGLGTQALTKVTAEFGRMAEQGLKLDAIQQSYGRLTKGIGQDGAAMLANLRTGTQGLVENVDLMNSANKAMLLGLPITAQSMGTLSKAATTLGRAMGQDATKSLDDLITALGRSSPMILDNLGLTVKVGEANEEYARKVKKTVDELTDQEKKLAFYEAAMTAADAKLRDLGEHQLTLTEQLSRAWTSVANAVSTVVSEANKAGGTLTGGAMAFSGPLSGGIMGAEMAAARARTAASAAAFRPSSPGVAEMNSGPVVQVKDYAAAIEQARKAVAALSADTRRQIDAALKLGESEDALMRRFGLSKDALVMYRDAMKGQAAAAKDAAKATKDYWADFKSMTADFNLRIEQEQKLQDALAADAEHYRLIAEWQDKLKPNLSALPMGTSAGPLKAPGEIVNLNLTEVSRKMQALGADVGASMIRAIEGGGSVAEAAGGTIGQRIGLKLSEKLNKALSGATGLAGALGGAVSAMLPGVGALLGPLMGKIADVFAGGEGHKANQLRDSLKAQLTTAVAGLENDPAIQAAMAKFNSAGSRKNVQAAFDEASKAAAAANAVMQKYGLSLDDLGTESAKLSKRTDALAKDFEELRGRGFSLQQVTKGAASQLNSMLSSALETGQKLPASLQPYIVELTKAGLLNDDLKNKLLGVANPVPWQEMQAAAEKFGISTEALGKQFEQAKLNAGTKELSDAWELLVKNGADINAVMSGMQDEVSAYVQKAQAMGLEIPASMKPIIDKMAEQGLLTDRNGEKLEGIGKLKYADPIVSDTDKLIAKLDELIEKLTGPNGLQAAFDGITFNTPGTGGTSHPETAHHGALVLAGSIRKYHQGTARVLPFPRLSADEFPAILQTGEAVLNRRAVQNIGEPGIQAMNRGGGVGGGSVVVQVTNHIHQQPGQDEQALARMVGTILERNTAGLRSRVKRVVGNGR